MARQDDSLVGVVNSTPLIALSIVGRLGLLRKLFDELFIPASVYEEVVRGGRGRPGAKEVAQANWLTVQKTKESIPLPAELMGLDQGEIDVILLAKEIEADWVLIDEKLARQIAKAIGLRVKGTLGVLLVAYRSGFISREEALEAVWELAQSSVRLSDKLVRWFEEQVG
jgi:predicted nucleic acid-binding protein